MQFKVDVHAHTVSSGHAYSTVKEYVDEASKKGLEIIGITDHAPQMPGAPSFLHFLNLKSIPKEINGIELLLGVELNILNREGSVDLREGILKKLDIVIASMHIPCFKPSTEDDNTMAVINTMKNPLVNIIGHLGDPRYPINIEKVVQVAKETNTIVELNNTSMNPNSTRAGGEQIILNILRECKKREVSISLGSDAHIYLDIGNFINILRLLKEVDMPEELILNTSKEKLKNFLLKKPKK